MGNRVCFERRCKFWCARLRPRFPLISEMGATESSAKTEMLASCSKGAEGGVTQINNAMQPEAGESGAYCLLCFLLRIFCGTLRVCLCLTARNVVEAEVK